jgi:hypothetical protein
LIADAVNVGNDRPAHSHGVAPFKAAGIVDATHGNAAKDTPGLASGPSSGKPDALPADATGGTDTAPANQHGSKGNGKDSAATGSAGDHSANGNSANGNSAAGQQRDGSNASPPGQSKAADHSANGNSAAGQQGDGSNASPPGQAKSADHSGDGNSAAAQQDAGSKASPPGQAKSATAQNNGSDGNAQGSGASGSDPGAGKQKEMENKQQNSEAKQAADDGATSNSSANGNSANHASNESDQDGVARSRAADETGNVGSGSVQQEDVTQDPVWSQQLAAVDASDSEFLSALTEESESTLEGARPAQDAIGVLPLLRPGRPLATAISQQGVASSSDRAQSETALEMVRCESVAGFESGSAADAALDTVMATLADPLQAIPATADGFLFAEGWHDLLAGARAAGDDMMHLVSRSGPAYWLTSAAIALLAMELIRVQRERAVRRAAGFVAWPEVVAPSGLA